MNFNSKTFGKRLQAKRLELGLSVKEFASKTKTSTGYINTLERGDCSAPSLDKLCTFCEVLDTSMDYLLKDSLEIYENSFGKDEIDQELYNIFHRLPSERKELLLDIVYDFQMYKELENNTPLNSLLNKSENSEQLERFVYDIAALDDEELKFISDMAKNIKNLKDKGESND